MCGFRVYPLSSYQKLVASQKLGYRMDFDIEVMVKMIWQGVNVRFIKTKVHYPEGGVSHFHALQDNILISKMHARLFFGMLLRFPNIILNKFRTN